MGDLIPQLPTGSALFIFVICLAIGCFVIVRYCLDQFDKPIAGPDDKMPWDFVRPHRLTSRQQYLTGFVIYCSIILLIFVVVSVLIGPGSFFVVVNAITAALTQTGLPEATKVSANGLQDYPTFPIVVAFYIVGLNPNLPTVLNFELPVRKLAHQLAYIPKNMDRIFNYMRFSQFDLPEDKVTEAYTAADLRRPKFDGDDLKPIQPLFDRVVVLYAEAAALSGDVNLHDAEKLVQQLDLDPFKQYRNEIQGVGGNLQGIDSRLLDLAGLQDGERQRTVQSVQRDLTRNLEVLYVIFACASTVQDLGRISDRLRAIGFTTRFPAGTEIPWNPILRVIGAAAVVLLIAYEIAANTWLGDTVRSSIPPTTAGILYVLFTILFVHAFAIGQALYVRAHLIASDDYFSETGRGNPVAYVKIAWRCWYVSVLWYLLLWVFNLAAMPLALGPGTIIGYYVATYFVWAAVPAWCGAMTAYTIDRPSDTLAQRVASSVMLGASMGLVAVLVVQAAPDMGSVIGTLTAQHPPAGAAGAAATNIAAATEGTISLPARNNAEIWYEIFNMVVYGGLGVVIGFGLPAALRRYWRSLEEQLPEQIGLLRANVLRYFQDAQQFNDWLNTTSDELDKHSPLDVLAEAGGVTRLTALVGRMRRKNRGS
jgi:Protein of unknown function (DUF2384)